MSSELITLIFVRILWFQILRTGIDLYYVDCLNRLDYEHGEDYQSPTRFAAEDLGHDDIEDREMVTDHPFLTLKRLLGDGSFYYSLDFNLTDHLQDR